MTALVWNQPGQRFFETGVDRGVLYPNNSAGVAWNGLISVEETVSGGETEAYYIDGIKYYDDVANTDFQANLTAFTYPDEFEPCQGNVEISPGMVFSNQPRETFGLAWRTKLGNDLDGIDHGYRYHLVWNATASPSSKNHETITDTTTPMNLQWEINAVPNLPGLDLYAADSDPGEWVWPEGFGMVGWPMGPDGNTPVKGWRATAYVYVDSLGMDPLALLDLENRLFGSLANLPYLPSMFDMLNMMNGFPELAPIPDWADLSGGGGGGVGGENQLSLLYTEVYPGALEELPGESIVPDGPTKLSDTSDATSVTVSSSWASMWYLYFDSTDLDTSIPRVNLKLRYKTNMSGTPLTAKCQLLDNEKTMEENGTDYVPGNKWWNLGGVAFDVVWSDGFVDLAFTINQAWIDNNPDQVYVNPGGQIDPASWTQGALPIADLLEYMVITKYVLIQVRNWEAPSSFELVSAVMDQGDPISVAPSGVHLGTPLEYTQSTRPDWPNPIMQFNDQTNVWSDDDDETFVRTTMYRQDDTWSTAGSNVVSAPIAGATGSNKFITSMTWTARVRATNDVGMETQSLYFDLHDLDYTVEFDYTHVDIPSDGEWHDITFTWTRQAIIDWGTDPVAFWSAMRGGLVTVDVSVGGSSVVDTAFTQQLDIAQLEVTIS